LPSITASHRRAQPARDEIGEAALPRRERLAAAEVESEELLTAVAQDGDNAQHRHADHLPGAPDTQRKAIEVEIDDVEVGQRPRPPCFQTALQGGDHARHGALRERRGVAG
jgi:hypothetical protein